MCFGSNSTTTKNSTGSSNTTGLTSGTTNSTTAPAAWLGDAAKSNLDFAQGVQQRGFTPYSGQQVASFAPQQSDSFNLGANVAGGVAPYVGETGSLIDNYAKAGPQSVSADTIASRMSPYMSSYVEQSLAPQLQAQDLQFANQNKGVDAAATSAGAYGDTGWGQLRGTTTQAQDAARTGLVANAYKDAFNTAIGAGAQDVANDMNAKTTNANLAETALGRQLTGANAIYQMGTGATTLDNTLGGQQTAQEQAQKNADYNQWMMSQQYPFQTTQLMDQAVSAGRQAAPTTTNGTTSGTMSGTTNTNGTETSTAPDNSGFGILGSIAGSALRFVADGGDVAHGQPTVVGERGPELIVPDGKGVVIPNEVLQAAKILRDQKVANGQGDPASSLQEAMQKPVRYMADGGFFGDLFGGGDGFASGASSLATGDAGPWQNPDGANATWQNPDGNVIPFGSSQGNANWKRLGDDLGSSKTWAPLMSRPQGASSSSGNLNLAQMPTPQPVPTPPQPQMPILAMAPVSLPGGGTSVIPQNMTTAPRAPAAMKFGIAA